MAFLKQRKFVLIFTIIATFFLGTIVGYWIPKSQSKSTTQTKTPEFHQLREKGYQYINPLLECEYTDQLGNPNTKNIESAINTIATKTDIETSVYFRDLNNGPWFGINLEKKFAPQSLLKLPLMFAYYKYAENNPEILQKKITYTGQVLTESNLDPSRTITPGQNYTIEYLIYRMVALSDNAAFETLSKSIPNDMLKKIHTDLSIPYPDRTTPQDYITVKSYSSLLRVLYNSSYLTRHYSNQALINLIKSDYTNGLVQKLPKTIKVAHKFGIKTLADQPDTTQLHDCGIIYHPKKPYILCIMTKGDNIDAQEQLISAISKATFDEMVKGPQ